MPIPLVPVAWGGMGWHRIAGRRIGCDRLSPCLSLFLVEAGQQIVGYLFDGLNAHLARVQLRPTQGAIPPYDSQPCLNCASPCLACVCPIRIYFHPLHHCLHLLPQFQPQPVLFILGGCLDLP